MLVRQLTKQLSRTLNTALSGIANAITKVLIDLSPTSNGFYSLGTDSVLTTAYKLGISTVLPTASTTYALFGRASSATDYLKILSSGYLSLDVDGTVVTSTVLATKDSDYREYSVTLSGNDFIFKENTTTISTVTNATAAAKTLTLNLIGKSNAGEFYLGILADPIMGSLEFELDQLTANFEYPVGNVFGSELWNTPTLNGWIDSGNDVYTLTGNGAFQYLNVTSGALDLVQITFTVVSIDGAMKIQNGGSVAFNFSDVGNYTVFVSGITSDIGFARAAGSVNCVLSNISIKQITNVITYQNIGTGTDVRDTYTLSNGDTQWISDLRTIDIAAQA